MYSNSNNNSVWIWMISNQNRTKNCKLSSKIQTTPKVFNIRCVKTANNLYMKMTDLPHKSTKNKILRYNR